jgi:predicted DNA-binding protein with PD1-like motif
MSLRTHVIRLVPGQDVRQSLETLAVQQAWPAACIVTAAGSLREARLRLAGATRVETYRGPLELVSLAGTLCPDGAHLHACIANEGGRTYGGHMTVGCTVETTVEAVLAVLSGYRFRREADASTGYRELVIETEAGNHA